MTLSPIEASSTQESLDGVRETLGEYEFTVHWQEGLGLNLDDVVAAVRSPS